VIRLIPVNEVDAVWPAIADAMERGCMKARSDLTAWDLYQHCRRGASFLVVVEKGGIPYGACVLDLKRDRTLDVVAFAGRDLEDWLPDLLQWEWLDTMGVTRVVAEGRNGLIDRLHDMIPGIRVIRQVVEWER
jgi:hypothetical protein